MGTAGAGAAAAGGKDVLGGGAEGDGVGFVVGPDVVARVGVGVGSGRDWGGGRDGCTGACVGMGVGSGVAASVGADVGIGGAEVGTET